jgi:hypothetical protein
MTDLTLPETPEHDDRFPRIAPHDSALDDVFPPGWSTEPTERDVAAMTLDDLFLGATPRQLAVARGAAVNLRDYRSPALKGWGTGWPQCGGARGNLVTVTADRSGARFSVHRRISVLFDACIDTMELRGYLCKPPQSGAYNCRQIAGTNSSSLHAWALAADINWTDNPYTTSGRYKMPLWVPREVFGPYGFAWGGDYSGSKKDYMHVEFMGTPAQADEQTRRRIAAVAPPSTVSTGRRLLRLTTPNMRGDDVIEVQKVLARWYGFAASWVDGVYGPGTAEQVRRLQRGVPPQPVLDADGIVGSATRRKLGLPV